MSLQRNVKREDRRRRMLREDTANRSATASSRSRSSTRATSPRAYTDAARADLQPRVTDFLPKRYLSLCVVFLISLMCTGVVQALYLLRVHKMDRWNLEGAEALGLIGTGTLASWTGSLFMLISAVVALVIFGLRRHKLDDYRGRYRVWLWVALTCLLASLDIVCGCHRLLSSGMIALTGTALWGDGSVWWMISWALIGMLVGTRLVWDVSSARLAVTALLAASLSYVAAGLLSLRVLTLSSTEAQIIVQSVLGLLGHQTLLFAFLVFARHVYWEAQGEAALDKKKARRKKTKGDIIQMPGEADDPQAKARPRRNAKKDTDHPSANTEDELAGDELEILTDPNLTKAERRKLRKQLKRQQRQAA